MRRAAVIVLVAGSYTMMLAILLLLVVALTTAFADGWNLRAASKRVIDRAPQFSPDGSRIAFIRSEEGRRRLWVMTAGGSDQQPRHGSPGPARVTRCSSPRAASACSGSTQTEAWPPQCGRDSGLPPPPGAE